jgi:putative mycofactocin binding protein MftB
MSSSSRKYRSTACAASTETVRPVAFDLRRAYRLNPAATLRPEPFGALAYHFGNRRLSFLKSLQLVCVVRLLGSHDSAAGALQAAGVPVEQWGRYAVALSALAESEVIDER